MHLSFLYSLIIHTVHEQSPLLAFHMQCVQKKLGSGDWGQGYTWCSSLVPLATIFFTHIKHTGQQSLRVGLMVHVVQFSVHI